jgi:hypothetical protein
MIWKRERNIALKEGARGRGGCGSNEVMVTEEGKGRRRWWWRRMRRRGGIEGRGEGGSE